jgi:hypothetical protein
MDAPPETLTHLDRATVASLLPGWTEQVHLLDRTYGSMAHGQVENPPEIGVQARPDTFVHAMPAYLRDEDVTALKWVSAYPSTRTSPRMAGRVRPRRAGGLRRLRPRRPGGRGSGSPPIPVTHTGQSRIVWPATIEGASVAA